MKSGRCGRYDCAGGEGIKRSDHVAADAYTTGARHPFPGVLVGPWRLPAISRVHKGAT